MKCHYHYTVGDKVTSVVIKFFYIQAHEKNVGMLGTCKKMKGRQNLPCVISSFRCSVNEIFALLECYAALIGS
jgi:hypothetical protein